MNDLKNARDTHDELDRHIVDALAGLMNTAPLAAERPTAEALLDDRRSSAPVRSRIKLAVAASAIVALGVGGLLIEQRDRGPAPAAAQYSAPTDPLSQLFVLPTHPQDLELSSGEVFTAPLDESKQSPSDGPVILIGTEVGAGFSDLVDVRVFGAIPDGFSNDQATEVDTATGPALVSIDGYPFGAVAQQRGEDWLLLAGATGNNDLLDLISQITIDPSGTPTLQSDQRVIIDEARSDETSRDSTDGIYSTFYDLTDPATGITFEIETATAPSAALLGTYTSNPITPTTVNGTSAWILTREDETTGDTHTGIVWRATPNRIIAIGAQAPLDDIQAMAERLQQVTEEKWLAALPGATTKN